MMNFTVVGYSPYGPPVRVAEFSVSEPIAENKIAVAARMAIKNSRFRSLSVEDLTLKVDFHANGGGYVHILNYLNIDYSSLTQQALVRYPESLLTLRKG